MDKEVGFYAMLEKLHDELPLQLHAKLLSTRENGIRSVLSSGEEVFSQAIENIVAQLHLASWLRDAQGIDNSQIIKTLILDVLLYLTGGLPRCAARLKTAIERSKDYITSMILRLVERLPNDPALPTRILEQCLIEICRAYGTHHSDNGIDFDALQIYCAHLLAQRSDRPIIFKDFLGEEPCLRKLPKLLFRDYDQDSAGTNGKSTFGPPQADTQDLMSMTPEDGAEAVVYHLTGKGFSKSTCRPTDRLTSWTGSMLAAMVYAGYRSRRSGRNSSTTFITGINTGDFVPGSFVSSRWLAKHYAGCRNIDKLLRFHDAGFDVAEYLSQGTVRIDGRSETATLQDAIDAGLYKLYPELRLDERGWITLIKNIRKAWSNSVFTRREEIQIAWNIAQKCWPSQKQECTLALLGCKERQFSKGTRQWKVASIRHAPVEVQRFEYLYEILIGDGRQRRYGSDEIFLDHLYKLMLPSA